MPEVISTLIELFPLKNILWYPSRLATLHENRFKIAHMSTRDKHTCLYSISGFRDIQRLHIATAISNKMLFYTNQPNLYTEMLY